MFSLVRPEDRPRLSAIEWVLRPFSRVRRGEGVQAVLLLACILLVMTSYYLAKTAREALILSRGRTLPSAEVKTYASAAMAVLLLALVPAYDRIAARVERIRLIETTYLLAIACLVAFAALSHLRIQIDLAYFVWMGISGVFLIAQFWSYANDLYSQEQGERLFAIIAIGGSLGAVLGPKLATVLPTVVLIPLAAVLLAASLALFYAVEHVHGRTGPRAAEPLTGAGGFHLVRGDRYLRLIAGLAFVATIVNTTGEYVLSSVAADHARHIVPATAHAELVGSARTAAIAADRREVLRAFYGDFYFLVNGIGFALQAFVVSRLVRVAGVGRALFVMPLVALGAYAAIGLVGGLALVRTAKVAENSADYSVENTARQLLFLPTGRAVKYKAKAAIDTFVVRAGDVVAAAVIGAGIHVIGLSAGSFAFVNVALVAVWLAIATAIARHRARLAVVHATPG